jgi:GrpB-like predicted nucleotidyltransferase (UPF0157 family)
LQTSCASSQKIPSACSGAERSPATVDRLYRRDARFVGGRARKEKSSLRACCGDHAGVWTDHNGCVTELPLWATEPVEICAPNASWSTEAEHEIDRLKDTLAQWLLSVEHVGSTAVPGLAAKPILDLQALVASWDPVGEIANVLASDDWHLVPPGLDRRSWRRLFVHVRDGHRHAHLHLMMRGAARWDEQLLFRDSLRRDPGLVEKYAALKRGLAATQIDRERYSEAKTEFVRKTIGTTARQ